MVKATVTRRRPGAAQNASTSPRLGGLAWPAVPGTDNSLLPLAMQARLQESEWWEPEKLMAHQLGQVHTLVRHAQATVPFYRDRLSASAKLPAAEFSLDTLRDIPLLTRSEIVDAGSALVTTALPAGHLSMRDVRTSGSTGRPVTVKSSAMTGLFFRSMNLRHHLWHRRDLSGKYVAIMTMKPGETRRDFNGWAVGFKTGPAVGFSYGLPIDELVNLVLDEEPDYLQIRPSTLEELIRQSVLVGRKPSRLKQACTQSEMVSDELRALCRDAWGAKISDIYSSEELGFIALQCPDAAHYHVQSENCLVEIIDDAGAPCPPGTMGRVVVTSLNNFASPLIRYELGDYATFGEPCPCGRGLPVIQRIAGRERNLAILPDGRKVTPTLSGAAIFHELPIRQFQLVQISVETIQAKLAVRRAMTMAEELRFAGYINEGLGHDFRFEFDYVEDIPRLPSGKYEVFRRAFEIP
ncbi:MAG: phenylacetate--CoA ligase family protein [Proteobacteria bacterium]|nr:phenylacetate--CoA ligase family protein [Pseudomonadota bacterium]